MNGIHEVTGSIPVWSTTLRSPDRRASYGWRANLRAKGVHRSRGAAKVDGWQATRRVPTVARSAKVGLLKLFLELRLAGQMAK